MKKLTLIAVLLVFSLTSGCVEKQAAAPAADAVPYSKENMKLGYDGQAFFSVYTKEFAETEEGYYYFDKSYEVNKSGVGKIINYLMFFDKEAKKSVPVCSLANCMHEQENEDCNAQFSAGYRMEQKTTRPYFLWYYDGNLYTIIINYTVNTYNYDLYQISLDGSKRTKYIELYTLYEEGGISIPDAFCHRGYIYYTITESDGIESLFRVKIEKEARPEQIVKLDNENSYIDEFQIYKTGITYSENLNTDENIISSIKYVDQNSGKVEAILDDTVFTMYTIARDTVYYTSNNEIYAYNVESKDREKIYSMNRGGYGYISYDGKYLYAEVSPVSLEDYSEHYIYVIDLEGNLIDSIQAPSSQSCYFGDSDYLFQMFDLNESLTGRSDMPMIKAFDKSQIGTGSHEWIELPIAK